MDRNTNRPPSAGGIIFVALSTAFLALMMMPVISIDTIKSHNRTAEPERAEISRPVTEPYYQTEPTTEETAEGFYPNGTYKVGYEIPEGYYILVYNGIYDTYGDAGFDVYGYSNEISKHFLYSSFVKLEKYSYIDMAWCDAYSLDTFDGENNPFERSGMFRVGTDVPAGTYKVIPIDERNLPPLWTVHEDIDSIDYDEIDFSYHYYEDDNEVTLKDGEILEMQYCYLEETAD
ncbi:MAG: hypothetical protein NC340_04835 [Ruminococcus flavefaciens]|nr:hypothetical protein [Ruminococcus flavefaciens]MCM1229010.1 hypothetical protein [Ruminococcus flavefaciens]